MYEISLLTDKISLLTDKISLLTDKISFFGAQRIVFVDTVKSDVFIHILLLYKYLVLSNFLLYRGNVLPKLGDFFLHFFGVDEFESPESIYIESNSKSIHI